MVKIYRTHDNPLIFNVDTLKNKKLNAKNFHRCLLNNVDVSGSDLSFCDFRSAEMISSVFINAIFSNSKLIMVKANQSLFDGCKFYAAFILHSDFCKSSLRNADFTDAVINDVDFTDCDLRGAIFDCNGLDTCCFNNAIFDDFTIWRKDFDILKWGGNKEN